MVPTNMDLYQLVRVQLYPPPECVLEMVFVSCPSKQSQGRAQNLGCELKAGANPAVTLSSGGVTAHGK